MPGEPILLSILQAPASSTLTTVLAWHRYTVCKALPASVWYYMHNTYWPVHITPFTKHNTLQRKLHIIIPAKTSSKYFWMCWHPCTCTCIFRGSSSTSQSQSRNHTLGTMMNFNTDSVHHGATPCSISWSKWFTGNSGSYTVNPMMALSRRCKNLLLQEIQSNAYTIQTHCGWGGKKFLSGMTSMERASSQVENMQGICT